MADRAGRRARGTDDVPRRARHRIYEPAHTRIKNGDVVVPNVLEAACLVPERLSPLALDEPPLIPTGLRRRARGVRNEPEVEGGSLEMR
jgi:hypothetical protein